SSSASSRSSSAPMRRDSAGWLRCKVAAARVKLPARATAAKASSWSCESTAMREAYVTRMELSKHCNGRMHGRRYLDGMAAVLPILVVVVPGTLHHLAQKTAGAATPWPMLAVAYGAALGLTLLGALVTGAPRPGRADGVTGLLVGLAAFGIEAGFFFVYRA